MTRLRGSTGVAMVLGSILFYWLPKTPSLGFDAGPGRVHSSSLYFLQRDATHRAVEEQYD